MGTCQVMPPLEGRENPADLCNIRWEKGTLDTQQPQCTWNKSRAAFWRVEGTGDLILAAARNRTCTTSLSRCLILLWLLLGEFQVPGAPSSHPEQLCSH